MIQFPDRYVVYDTETTGLDVTKEEPIEIAAIKYEKGMETERKQWLIKPSKPISEEITKITGITNELLNKEGRDRNSCLKEFFLFIHSFPVVGHNISRFDNPLVTKYDPSFKIDDWIDTAALFKAKQLNMFQRYNETHKDFATRILKLVSGVKYNLSLAFESLGGIKGQFIAHRAMGDCEMTNFVYQSLCLLKPFVEKKSTPEMVNVVTPNHQEIVRPHHEGFRFGGSF